MSTNVPAHPYTTPISTKPLSKWYIPALGLAQFGIFIAILAPVIVSMQLKAQELQPDNPAALIGTVLPIGALAALVGNPVFGALSDRTRTRWGRRKPWLIGGILGLTVGLTLVAFSTDVLTLTLSWLVCQLASNAASAALIASFADNVPVEQRGKASSTLALAQNVSILAGVYGAVLLVNNLPVLFIVPGIIGVVLVTIYVLVAPDVLPEKEPRAFSLKQVLGTFWTNPFKFPDFGLAWWSRFLITFASFMFTTYRLLYIQEHIGLDAESAVGVIALGVLLYTVALMIAAFISGWLSDKLGRRKIFVAGSTALTGIGFIVLALGDTIAVFYIAELILGLAFGVYAAVDTALVVDVLPNPEKPGKDLGVINIANSLPQSLAPAFALLLLGVGGGTDNYVLMLTGAGVIAIIGALVIIPIKKVR